MEIIDELFDETLETEYRVACRGIIFKENQLILIYCGFYNDYSFPGGGVENGENLEDCVKREVLEEVGIISNNVKLFDIITEKRRSQRNLNKNFIQKNYYYSLEYHDEIECKLENYEIEYGYEKALVSLDDAITHNLKVLDMIEKYRHKFLNKINYQIDDNSLKELNEFGSPTAIKRELYILQKLKENTL